MGIVFDDRTLSILAYNLAMATDIATTGHPAAVTAVITAAVMAADTTDKR